MNIDRNGRVSSTPKPFSEKQDAREKERAKRFGSFAKILAADSSPTGLEYERLTEVMKVLFSHPGAYIEYSKPPNP